ncbi:unnamed protein product [Pleuronectes platessa]|uniref:VWFA domain-containing protein n=1 Tax=Pleuronectes platessa TaxID=8262 RepID=A0A9N7ZDR5_PLEPL|nr:unnamed protein product [Pleuronectes platessa]
MKYFQFFYCSRENIYLQRPCRKSSSIVITDVLTECWTSELLPAAGEDDASCDGAFDIYFVLDRSGSVHGHWDEIYGFAEQLTNRFVSPRMRVSYIVFSAKAVVILPLTGDRSEIDEGLKKLSQIKPAGETYMHEGMIAVSEQMKAQTSPSSTIIIILTDGKLEVYPYELSVQEADKARGFGARVYCVGVMDFDHKQLAEIADSTEQVFPVLSGFHALKDIVNSILKQTCTDVFTIEPSSVCVNESFNVVLRGSGFSGSKRTDNVLCVLTVNQNTYNQKPSVVRDGYLLCPAPALHEAGESIEVLVSLNNGESFISSPITIYATTCVIRWDLGALVAVGSAAVAGSGFDLVVLASLLHCGDQRPTLQIAPLLLLLSLSWKTITHPNTSGPQWTLHTTGGRGPGGITRMEVRWGQMGSTEEGSRLEKAKNAVVTMPEDVEDPILPRPPPRPPPVFSPPPQSKWYTPIKGRFDALRALMRRQYDRVAIMRPTHQDKGRCINFTRVQSH